MRAPGEGALPTLLSLREQGSQSGDREGTLWVLSSLPRLWAWRRDQKRFLEKGRFTPKQFFFKKTFMFFHTETIKALNQVLEQH